VGGATQLFPLRTPDYFVAGNYYFSNEENGVYDTQRAYWYYQQTLLRDGKHPHARHQIARIDFLKGRFPEALATIDSQITLFGTSSPSSYYVRGLIHGYNGTPERGVSDFKTYLSLRGDHWAGYNDLAWLYFLQGDVENAQRYLEEGLVIAPTNAWLLASYGAVLLNRGNLDEAKEVLTLAYDATKALTEAEWSKANPGNDPRVARWGIEAMLQTITGNIALLETGP